MKYNTKSDFSVQVSYSLTQLAETQLKKDRREVSPHNIPPMFQSSEELLKLV
jgi:DNA polymerase alpha subunit A